MNLWDVEFFENQRMENERVRFSNQVRSVNQSLQELLKGILSHAKVKKEDGIVQLEKRLNREFGVVHATLWHLMYANNYENPKVLTAQLILIHQLLKEKHPKADLFKYKLETLEQQVYSLDTQAYQTYMMKRDTY